MSEAKRRSGRTWAAAAVLAATVAGDDGDRRCARSVAAQQEPPTASSTCRRRWRSRRPGLVCACSSTTTRRPWREPSWPTCRSVRSSPWTRSTTSPASSAPSAAPTFGCNSIRGSAGRPPIPSCDRTSPPKGGRGHPDRALRHRSPWRRAGHPSGDVRDQPHRRRHVRRRHPAVQPRGNPDGPAGRDRRAAGRLVFRHRRDGRLRRAVELAEPRPRADPGGTSERGQHVDRWRCAHGFSPDGDRFAGRRHPTRAGVLRRDDRRGNWRRPARRAGVRRRLGVRHDGRVSSAGTTNHVDDRERRQVVPRHAVAGGHRHRGLRVSRRLPRRAGRVAVRRLGRRHVYGESRAARDDRGHGPRGRSRSRATTTTRHSPPGRSDPVSRVHGWPPCRSPSSTSATSFPSMGGTGR